MLVAFQGREPPSIQSVGTCSYLADRSRHTPGRRRPHWERKGRGSSLARRRPGNKRSDTGRLAKLYTAGLSRCAHFPTPDAEVPSGKLQWLLCSVHCESLYMRDSSVDSIRYILQPLIVIVASEWSARNSHNTTPACISS